MKHPIVHDDNVGSSARLESNAERRVKVLAAILRLFLKRSISVTSHHATFGMRSVVALYYQWRPSGSQHIEGGYSCRYPGQRLCPSFIICSTGSPTAFPMLVRDCCIPLCRSPDNVHLGGIHVYTVAQHGLGEKYAVVQQAVSRFRVP